MSTNGQFLTQRQESLHRTLSALGTLQEACPAFPGRPTRQPDSSNEILRTNLAACGIESPRTLNRFGIALARIPAGNTRDCQEALQGARGVWGGGVAGSDTKVVFVDRPIDALAYEEYRSGGNHCVLSIGRELTPELRNALKQAIDKLPPDKSIVTAFANDPTGAELRRTVQAMAGGRTVVDDGPPRGRTWAETNIEKQRDTIRSLGLASWLGIDRGR
jgi:hypothetical protein